MTPIVPIRKDFPALLKIIGCLILVRLLFIAFMPQSYAVDMYAWPRLIDGLNAGKNPYAADLFNYPPFWIQIVYIINKLSLYTAIPVIRLIQVTLIAAEILVVLVSWSLLRRFFNVFSPVVPFIVAFALNPILVLLNCQHGNIDIIVALWLLLCVYMILDHLHTQSPVSWLMACFFLGLGILTKTIPLMLAPLLLIGIRRLPVAHILFGAALLLLPVTLGMSIVYVLEPDGVTRNVLGYRSLGGWYGITGILSWLNASGISVVYSRISPWIMMSLMSFLGWFCWRRGPILSVDVVRIALLLLVFIPTFGPGYSPPYTVWFVPLLIILYFTASPSLRRLLLVGYFITSLDYIIEYAFFNSHGAFMSRFIPQQYMYDLCDQLGARHAQVLIRMPMFLFFTILYITLIRDLSRSARQPASNVLTQ